jgi:acyl carrier protein
MNLSQDDVQDVFRDVFDADQLTVTESTTAADIPGWDSLGHINLIIAIEKRFGIKFANAEISRLKAYGSNVGTLMDMLHQKIR